MTILFKYIVREILKQFAVIATVVVVVYVAIDFFEKFEDVLEARLPLGEFFTFFFLKTPLVLVQTTPGAILIATLVVFGLMKRNNEITALKSSGLGRKVLIQPAAITGIGFCVILFLLSEVVVPKTISQANFIWLTKVRHKAASKLKKHDVWIKDSQVIMHIKHYNAERQLAFGITLNFFDRHFTLTRRIDARNGVYTGGQWVLRDVMDHRFTDQGQVKQSEMARRRAVKLDIVPQDLVRAARSSEEMGFFELLGHIRKIAREGYSTVTYRVDLHAKIAFPFVCLLMTLLGTALGTAGKSIGGMVATIAYGIVISFVYWMLYGFSLSLGYGGILPPIVAAWTANIVFLIVIWGMLARSG